MSDEATVGSLAIKIIPDASGFQMETAASVRAAGAGIESALSASLGNAFSSMEAEAAAAGAAAGKAYSLAFRESVDLSGSVSAKAAEARAAATLASTGSSRTNVEAEARAATRAAVIASEAEVARATRRGTVLERIIGVGESGRAGRNTSTAVERAMKSASFTSSGPLSGVASTFGLMGGQASVAGGAIAGVSTALAGVAAGAIGLAAVSAGFAAISVKALQGASSLQQQQVAFRTMMKDAAAGDQMMQDVIAFALKTPFDTEQVATGAKRLMAYGFAAKDVLPVLSDIGDASAALGLDAGGMDRLITAIGQIRTKGKLSSEEVRQLAENGIPVWEYLAKAMSLSTAEVMKLTEQGLIPADQALSAIRQGMEGSFGGSMNAQVQTLAGSAQQLKEALTTGFEMNMMKVLPSISSDLRSLTPALMQSASSVSDSLGLTIANFTSGVKDGVAAAIPDIAGTLNVAMGEWTPTFTNLTNALSQAIQDASPAFDSLSKLGSGVTDKIAQAFPAIAQQISEISQQIQAIGPAMLFAFNPGQIVMTLSIVNGALSLFVGTVIQGAQAAVSAWSGFVGMLASAFEAIGRTSLPGHEAFAVSGAALRQLSNDAEQTVKHLEGVQQRSNLDIRVSSNLNTVESILSTYASSINRIPKDILFKAKIDPQSFVQGDPEQIKRVLGLPDEVLQKVGIDRTHLTAAMGVVATVLNDPAVSKDVKMTINADPAGAIAAAAQADAAVSQFDAKTAWAKLMADPANAQAGANAAKAAIDRYTTPVPSVKLDADPTPVLSGTATAKGAIDGVKQGSPVPLSADPSQVFGAATVASAIVNSVKQGAPTPIAADPAAAFAASQAAQGAVSSVQQPAPAPINADPSPAATAAASAQGSILSVQQPSPTPLNADPGPLQAAVAAAQGSVGSVRQPGPTPINADASGAIAAAGAASSALDAATRARTATITAVIAWSSPIGPGLPAATRVSAESMTELPSASAGMARVSAQKVLSTVADTLQKGPAASPLAGWWSGQLGSIIGATNKFRTMFAGSVTEALKAATDAEFRTQRRIDDARTAFSRRQEDQADALRERMTAAENGKTGAALEAQQRISAATIKNAQRRAEDERTIFDRQLEDQKRYYDAQVQRAQVVAQRLEDIQGRIRGSVDWNQLTNPESLIRNLNKNAATMREYAANMAALKARGLSEQAQAAFEQMDPLNAARLAARLASSPALIGQLNDAYRALLSSGMNASAQLVTRPTAAPAASVRLLGANAAVTSPTSGMTALALAPNVAVTVNPSKGMSEVELAKAVGREVTWAMGGV